MQGRPRRGAWLRVTPLVALTLTAGCAVAHRQLTATAAANPPASTATAVDSAADPAVTAALTRAVATVRATRSYTFSAVETLNTTRPTSTRVTGRVVRGQGIAYTLTTGRGSTEVVRGRQATFVRDRAGHWQRLRHPHPLTDPTGSLLAILTGITQTYLIAPGVIVALLPQEAARHAGLLGGRDPVQVRILLDRAGHVVRLETTTTASVGTRRIALTVDTHYGQFGRVPPIRMPA